MRTSIVCSTLLGICLLGSLRTAQAAEKIQWAKSYTAAVADARSHDKLIMADFYTDWCGWCKKLDADTYSNAKVVQLSNQLVPVKVNAEKEGVQLAKKYGVNGYPTILFLNADGDVEAKIVGYKTADGFSEDMQKAISTHKDFPALLARYKSNPNDLEATAKLAGLYAARGNRAKAKELLAQAEKLDPDNAKGFLTKTYTALGDSYQEDQQFDQAIPLFQKAARTGKDPYDLAYAHISIAVCYLQQNKIPEAVPELKATVAVPNVPKDMKDQAQQILEQIRQHTSQ
jgi:thiol-disulfide isomerase/thioredoxin